jgi:predicted membrane-bound mannosyltransferase
MLLWALLGIILIAVIWALISAAGNQASVKKETAYEAPAPEIIKPEKVQFNKTDSWEETTKATVSKNFGKGGVPTGVSRDSGGLATSGDDDIEMLKNAQAFEPRATANLNLEPDEELEKV